MSTSKNGIPIASVVQNLCILLINSGAQTRSRTPLVSNTSRLVWVWIRVEIIRFGKQTSPVSLHYCTSTSHLSFYLIGATKSNTPSSPPTMFVIKGWSVPFHRPQIIVIVIFVLVVRQLAAYDVRIVRSISRIWLTSLTGQVQNFFTQILLLLGIYSTMLPIFVQIILRSVKLFYRQI